MEGELKKIKKLYGEEFAKYCRSSFPGILEKEGLLLDLLLKNFAPSRSLYKELINKNKIYLFKGFIFNQAGIYKPERRDIDKTPEQLLESVGYKLYRCKTDKEVKSFKKYYRSGEVLCTFRDPERIKKHHIFFVVREDVDSIKREDFKYPKREDRYGTSVMSLQFDRETGQLSIKNRYNHTVRNPDNTHGNDLDSIVPGLADSFAKYYGLESRVDYSQYTKFDLPGFVRDKYGVLHKYNTYVRNKDLYFCENNIVIHGNGSIEQYDKDKYELVNTFLIDKSAKTIKDLSGEKDSFTNLFVDIEKIEVIKNRGETRDIVITKNDGTYFKITVDETGAMTHYENNFQTEVEGDFLLTNTTIKTISIPKAKKIGKNFLTSNIENIKSIDFPEVEEIGYGFLRDSTSIESVNLPKLKTVGAHFLYNAREMRKISLPELEIANDYFMTFASRLTKIQAPKLKALGDCAMAESSYMESIDLPELEIVGRKFLCKNTDIKQVNFPKLKVIGNEFLIANEDVRSINLPEVERIGHDFMPNATKISKIRLPKVKTIGTNFMMYNRGLRQIDLPSVEIIDSGFLRRNKHLRVLNVPKLRMLGGDSLVGNVGLRILKFPSLEYIGTCSLLKNTKIKVLDVSSLQSELMGVLTSVGKIKKIRISKKILLPKNLSAKVIEEVDASQPEN